MKIVLKQIVIVTFSSLILACAASNQVADEDDYAANTRGSDCISQGTVRDYRVLDDSNLIVTAGVRRKYHIVLYRRAYGLRSTWQIGFNSPTGQICSGFSDLLVSDGLSPQRIRIQTVTRLTPEDEEDLLIRFGKIEPAVEQTPAAEDVEGAAVEELD